MMARRLVAGIEKRLCEVLIPRDVNDPACYTLIDLKQGKIELSDAMINPEFLRKRSSLPFEIRDSSIRRVSIHFPLKALLSRQQVKVQIEGLALVLVPRKDLTLDEARNIFREERQRAIAASELAMDVIFGSLAEEDDGKDSMGARAFLKAALKRSTQQALHNAAVTIENVHLRYECETKYDMLQGFAACGVTVRELIIGDGWQAAADEREEEEAEARRDRDRDAKAKGREEPEARARSTACSVTQFGLYCEPERQRKATAASCLPPSPAAVAAAAAATAAAAAAFAAEATLIEGELRGLPGLQRSLKAAAPAPPPPLPPPPPPPPSQSQKRLHESGAEARAEP